MFLGRVHGHKIPTPGTVLQSLSKEVQTFPGFPKDTANPSQNLYHMDLFATLEHCLESSELCVTVI